MIEPTSKTIPEKLCDINQSQMDQLRLLTPSSSTEVASRGGSRAAATSKIERFVIIVNGWKPLTIITKRSILDVAAALDPPLASLKVMSILSKTRTKVLSLKPKIAWKK